MAVFKKIFESAPDAIVVTDRQGRIVCANVRAEKLFGYGPNELLGQIVEILVPEPLRAVHVAHRESEPTRHQVRPFGTLSELSARRKDGSEFPADIMLSPVETDEGWLAVTIIHDLTERKRAEESFRLLAEGTDNLHKALLNSISHNLRTPVASVTGALNSVLEDGYLLDAPTQRELLETAREEAKRLDRLVRNLLDMTRLDGNAIHIKTELCDVQDVVGSALAQLGEAANQRRISVVISPHLPLISMDSALIVQVVVNLLENALKYSGVESPIEVEAKMTGDRLQLCVRDGGNGIAEGDIEHVFDKFYRGASAGVAQGAGLGLSICKGFIEAHHGQIWIERRDQGGTEVKFTLPTEQKR
ncbi:MAG TPA: ATP-binding protein [Candidatus Sulfotelmatobacter sp.]|nr:ATP-binding protein [Candidatus Sulfotelmatobacter sp.]